MTLIWLLVAGIISGIVGGMGMGGGTLLIPILTIFLSFKQKSAQAINLLAFIPMSIVALIIHIKNKLVDFKVGIPIVLTGINGALGLYSTVKGMVDSSKDVPTPSIVWYVFSGSKVIVVISCVSRSEISSAGLSSKKFSMFNSC